MAELSLNLMLGNLQQVKKKLEGVSVGGGAAAGPAKGEAKKSGANLAVMAAGIGALVGLIGGLAASMGSVQGLLQVLGGLLNSLVAPFVPILIGLLKPVLVVLQVLMRYMLKFFMDPVGNLKKALEAITGVVAKLLGLDPSELNGYVTSFLAAIDNIVGVFTGVKDFLVGVFTGDFKKAWGGLKAIWTNAIQYIGNMLSAGIELLALPFKAIANQIDQVFGTDFLGQINLMIAILKEAISFLVSFFTGDWKGAWESLKKIGGLLLDLLVKIFQNTFQVLKTFGTWVWNGLVAALTAGFNILKNLGQWIMNKIKEKFGFGGNTKTTSVGDAVITPQGQVVKTDPNDYLIATKTPGNLGGGNVINITVEGSMNEEVLEQMTSKLRMELTRMGDF